MKRLFSLVFALLLALSLAACATAPQTAQPDIDVPELVLLPSNGAAEDIGSPDAQTDDADAQAPPETQAEASESEEPPLTEPDAVEPSPASQAVPDEHGSYDSKDEVALFIHLYGHLPDNYISKKEAQALGWSGGSLEAYAPGMCIGGSRFGNYEGLLPDAEGRRYTECDIDTLGADSRGAKRIVFSNDGLIYYTADHYKSFELLYGEE